MTRVYYKEAVGAFVVFDVTRISTYEAVKKWKNDIDAKVTIPGTTQAIPVVLLANKIDLVTGKEGWGKTKEEMDKFCDEHGFIAWFETSSKNNTGIDEAANALVKSILDIDDPNKIKLVPGNPNEIKLVPNQHKEQPGDDKFPCL